MSQVKQNGRHISNSAQTNWSVNSDLDMSSASHLHQQTLVQIQVDETPDNSDPYDNHVIWQLLPI